MKIIHLRVERRIKGCLTLAPFLVQECNISMAKFMDIYQKSRTFAKIVIKKNIRLHRF